MTKRPPVMSDHDLVKQTPPRRGRRNVGRVGKRGRGGIGICELIPVVEKLTPRRLKAGRGRRGGRGGRGGRGRGRGRGGAKDKSLSPKRVTRKRKAVVGVSSVWDEECGLRGEECEVGEEGKESESKLGGSEVEDGAKKTKDEKCETGIKGNDGIEESVKEKKEEPEMPIEMPVPKLRRSHATVIIPQAMLHKDSTTKPESGTDPLISSDDGQQCNVQDTSATLPSTERTVLKRRRGRPRKTPRQNEDTPSIQSCAVSSSPTREEVDAAIYSVPTPTELAMLTQLLTTPVITTTNLSLDVLTSDVMSDTSTTTTETEQSREVEEEYPQPSTYYQKMQRRLARQKQLSEMRAREMAMEREKRFLRRQGLLERGKKSNEEQRRVQWKEEGELVEVFHYSPCSSRGSTLEPDEIPDIVDPT